MANDMPVSAYFEIMLCVSIIKRGSPVNLGLKHIRGLRLSLGLEENPQNFYSRMLIIAVTSKVLFVLCMVDNINNQTVIHDLITIN